jgi:hypothetical protein
MTFWPLVAQIAFAAVLARVAFLAGRASATVENGATPGIIALTPESAREVAQRLTILAWARESLQQPGAVVVEINAGAREISIR